MTAQRFLVVAAILATGVLAGGGIAMADATSTPVHHGGESNLVLTVTSDQAKPGQPPHGIVLTCNPSGGTHPHAAVACSELNQAGGDFSRLPKRQEFCSMLYQPVTATAHGVFSGRRIDFQQKFPNHCWLTRNTGRVFDF